MFWIRREVEVAARYPIAEVTEFDVQLFQGRIRSDKILETVILLIRGFNTDIEKRRTHDLLGVNDVAPTLEAAEDLPLQL